MIIPSSLKDLVALLKLRKRQPGVPYNLLLTSTISLTPDIIKQICQSSDWTKFSSYLHKRGTEYDDLINLLTEHIGIHNNLDGYRALVHLIGEGYFSTILTTNLDSTLEDQLLATGLPPDTLQTLIVGDDKDEAVARALDGQHNSIRIIKLHGSLRERILPKQFPDFSKPPSTIRASLERVLNQEIVIVGSVKQDEDIMRVMNASKKSQIYYAIPRKSSYDTIIKLIEARGDSLHRSLISGKYGEFTSFFQTLASLLSLSDMPSPPSQHSAPPFLPLPTSPRRVPTNDKSHIADVLLVTVTEIEAKAVLDCCPENKLCFIDNRAYYDLGIIGNVRTFMVQSGMGSDGLGGSRFTVGDGISALSPSAVIMVGIAFGMNEEEQHIGDVLVSRQLVAYDHQRIGSSSDGKPTIHIRGDRVSASAPLLDKFRAGYKTWQKPPYVHFGLILSGTKLIANQNYRDQLRQIEPEAIGGEMEGVGLYEAAQRYKVDWLLVKAICDWGDSNKSQDKEKRQKDAAENAARFTLHVIQQGGFHNSQFLR